MKRFKRISQHCRLLCCAIAVFLWAGNALALNATDTLQAESYSGQSGVTTETCSEGGQNVTSIQGGDYLYFNNVNFGTSGIQCFEARVAGYGNGGFIEVRLDSLAGTLVGTCEILPPTGGWQTWTSKACKVTGATGTHTVYLKFTGGVGTYPISNLFNLNWFKFHGTPTFTTTNWRQTTTTAKGIWNTPITLSAATAATPVIQINPDSMFQRVDGWGGAFNENGAHCISSLSAAMKTAVMRELYDPVNGCRFNTGRIPIGMSDFTVNKVYSLDEIPSGSTDTTDYTMKYFSLHNDSLMNIPFVKAAMAVNPNIMIYGSPWTPPQWMKTNKSWQGGSNPTIIQNAQIWTAYALYFSKFIKGWQQAGISVNIVYPQNEPGYNTSGHPSCSWSGTQLMQWVRDYLYPKLRADTIGTQIWMGTFNTSNYTADMQPTLDDTSARKMITGIGTQRDGNNAMLTASQNAYYRSLHYHGMETETNCWSGSNSWTDAANTFQQIYNHEIANTQCYNMWNMILDSNYNYVSWMARAQNSMIQVVPSKGTVKYMPEFYIMKHWSYYVRVAAVRLYNTNTNTTALRAASFKNPDGTIILEVQNYSTAAVSPLIRVGSLEFTPTLAASSVNTFNIGGTEPTGNWTPVTSITGIQPVNPNQSVMAASGTIGVYDISGRLVKTLKRSSKIQVSNMVWNHTDESGRRVAPGLYIIMDRTGKTANVQKVICQ